MAAEDLHARAVAWCGDPELVAAVIHAGTEAANLRTELWRRLRAQPPALAGDPDALPPLPALATAWGDLTPMQRGLAERWLIAGVAPAALRAELGLDRALLAERLALTRAAVVEALERRGISGERVLAALGAAALAPPPPRLDRGRALRLGIIWALLAMALCTLIARWLRS